MADRWRVGVAGLASDRVWGMLEQWRALADVSLAAAADGRSERLTRGHDDFGVRRLYPNWRQMLDGEDLHFIQVGLCPGDRAELAEEATARGIHLLFPGPLAASLDQAERILSACRRNGCQVVVDFGHPSVVWELARRLEEQQIGGVLQVVFRDGVAAQNDEESAAHRHTLMPGESERGGVLAHGCATGIHLCRSLLGVPSSVTASLMSHHGEDAADTGAVILEYSATQAVVTACRADNVNSSAESELIARGEFGTLLVRGTQIASIGVDLADVISSLEERPNGPGVLVGAALANVEPTGFYNAQVGRDTQEILDAALISSEQRRTVFLPLR